MIAQGKTVSVDYAAHLKTLVDQGAVAIPLLEAYLMTGAHQLQVHAPAGGVIQPPGEGSRPTQHPGGGGQHVQPPVQPPVNGPPVNGLPAPDQPLDMEAENACVAAEVARNIAIENNMADVYDSSRDFQHLMWSVAMDTATALGKPCVV